jgi:hypothetical protein
MSPVLTLRILTNTISPLLTLPGWRQADVAFLLEASPISFCVGRCVASNAGDQVIRSSNAVQVLTSCRFLHHRRTLCAPMHRAYRHIQMSINCFGLHVQPQPCTPFCTYIPVADHLFSPEAMRWQAGMQVTSCHGSALPQEHCRIGS